MELMRSDDDGDNPPPKRPEIWSKPVDGPKLANRVRDHINSFVILPPHADTILTMCVFGTYFYRAGVLPIASRVVIQAPDAGVGKTTTMAVLADLIPNAYPVSRPTPAKFAQVCAMGRVPMIDQMDKIKKSRPAEYETIVGDICSGFSNPRFGNRATLDEDMHLDTPVFVAGIGNVANEELDTRAFKVFMRSAGDNPDIRDYDRVDEADTVREIVSQLYRYAIDHKRAVRDMRPVMDASFKHRERDKALPLLKIADVIGAEWPELVREALKVYRHKDSKSDGQELFTDLATLINDGTVNRYYLAEKKDYMIFSTETAMALVKRFTDRPCYDGFGPKKMSIILRGYEITSDEGRKPGGRKEDAPLRGYWWRHLEPWFANYKLAISPPDEPTTSLPEPNPIIPEILEPVAEPQPSAKNPIAVARANARHHGTLSDYGTPPELFDPMNAEFGFTLDVCATAANAKVPVYFTPEQDGLKQDWGNHIAFMNSPHGSATAAWIQKAYEASLAGATVACLVPVHTHKDWWKTYAQKGEIRFIEQEVRWVKPDGTRTATLNGAYAWVIFRPPPAVITEGSSALPEPPRYGHSPACDKLLRITKAGVIRDHKSANGKFCLGSKEPPVFH